MFWFINIKNHNTAINATTRRERQQKNNENSTVVILNIDAEGNVQFALFCVFFFFAFVSDYPE